MCGIAGVLHFNKKPVTKQLLKAMNDTISHRGPDAEGYHFDDGVGIAHRRLSIIDLSGGKQPLANEDDTVWIVFNGEIYNFQELKKDLEGKGHQFSTHSDTEVIVHMYEEYGEESVSYLQGMFAYAIWDKRKQKLFIARDRVGIKPVYYFFDGKKLIFASEIKPILKYGDDIPRDLDYTAIYDYFTFSFIPAPKSIFAHIKKLDAGHCMSINMEQANLDIRQYWDISFAEKLDSNEHELKEMILDNLRQSVSSHLISDVPLGAFLSGGIDSSAVAATMAGIINEPVKTCSIGFDIDRISELPYAREVAKLYKTDHFEHVVRPDAVSILDHIVHFYDEPFADTSAIPSYYLSQITRRKVTVALSGDGGDEDFAGYRRYVYDCLENRLRQFIPAVIRQPVFGALGSIYPKADWLPQVFRAKTLFQNIAKDSFDAYFNTISVYDESFLNTILTPEFRRELGGYRSRWMMEKYYHQADSNHFLDKVLYTEIKTFLPDDYLVKVDRASMAHALEVRVPLLDHKFMEFCAKIPADYKLKGFTSKYIFKKSLEKLLPDSILYRKKQGFEIPIDTWLRKELQDKASSILMDRGSFISTLIQRSYIEKLWNQHQSGLKNYGNNLWMMLFLESWHKKYIANVKN
ncbi:MAG: amidotransferase 1, exosortase A system-associated [Candidatus Auribacter fodinae]|jgi:asparagine synthase (glutamine-hydrolysing)|uniref:asparagine synthase (glutamine-hydrolyzing) n=1 Tax=Candidatus Auribacter fodinae TaxID=2093366 RepID=A0A3A4QRM1_9BACT|nr:MAG: amidotransferase 1, exosortase A system-associated [Candidatus Auribacter fodinae]